MLSDMQDMRKLLVHLMNECQWFHRRYTTVCKSLVGVSVTLVTQLYWDVQWVNNGQLATVIIIL